MYAAFMASEKVQDMTGWQVMWDVLKMYDRVEGALLNGVKAFYREAEVTGELGEFLNTRKCEARMCNEP